MKKIRKMLPVVLAATYLLLLHFLMGLRSEHVALIGFILGCYYAHPRSRQFALDFLPAALFGVIYDFLRILPKSWAGSIHVVWPYQLEKILFGFYHQGTKIIPCEFFQNHHYPFVDFVTGATYSLHVVVPLAFALLIWFKKRDLAQQFLWAFFLVNIFAFITYVVLPVAPPWYVQQYGLTPGHWSIPPSAAGLIRFDQLIGTPYFQNVYAKNAWVFGAIPSMHGGFPWLVILFAHQIFSKRAMIPFYLFMALVWFSAVYLGHHYIIDLIAGGIYSAITVIIIRYCCGFSIRARSSLAP
ncbi:MAG: inositol phosphorylceramide synthase [Deltaproteobacteria bacterium]|nr:inositol phosphorylceramide synthase [Deltaproteobacteria bacterium]